MAFCDLIFVVEFIHHSLFYVQLPQPNPGFNNTPFKFTKYSNAYMLVYIRESDKDKIMCNVDEKDIAEHLRVRLSVQLYIFFLLDARNNFFSCAGTFKERARREREA